MRENPWQTHSSKISHQNRWFKVRTDQVTTPNGKTGEYNVMEMPPSVFIVAVNEKLELCLIHEFRYPHQQWLWEVPVGSLEKSDSNKLEAAKRELQEETGLRAKHWQQLGSLLGIKGMTNQQMLTFLATGLTANHDHTQVAEGIAGQRFVSFSQFFADVKSGEIIDAETICVVTLAALELGQLPILD